MANKVLSIKMDEKDIERIKKYYDSLIKAGFISSNSMSLNAFYKHLLLDYLEEDFIRAFDTYSYHGITPKIINPDSLDRDKKLVITNTYNLDAELFDVYKRCVKEALNRRIVEMKENAVAFNEVLDTDVVVESGHTYQLEYIMNIDGGVDSFWNDKAFETIDILEKEYRENGIYGDIVIVENSSVADELKQKLINEIKVYERKRKQNFRISHGNGVYVE